MIINNVSFLEIQHILIILVILTVPQHCPANVNSYINRAVYPYLVKHPIGTLIATYFT